MASSSISFEINVDIFDRLEETIRATFEKIVSLAVERRDHLLSELTDMKLTYIVCEETRVREIRDLENIISQLTEMSVQQNKIAKLHEEHILKMKQEQKVLSETTSLPSLKFNTCGLKSVLENLKSVGGINDDSDLYKNKKHSMRNFGREGGKRGELNLPLGISLDDDKRLYVADHWNKRVQVFSLEGRFLAEIGKGHLKCPYSLQYAEGHIFVSDWNLNTVFKFEIQSGKLVCKSVEGEFNLPFGLTVDTSGEVLVADMKNNRVVLCTPNLKFIHEIGRYKLTTPRAVLVHLDQVIIADNSDTFNIHIYAKTGEFLKSFIKLENGTDHIFMCLDLYSNIIVSDDKGKSIQIYNTEGERVHRIECKGYPRGVLVSGDQIVCARFENVVDFY